MERNERSDNGPQGKWMEFDGVNAKGKSDRRNVISENQQQRQWEPLKEGIVKINIDAPILTHMVRTGKGIIARNWIGKIIKAEGMVEAKRGEAALEEVSAVREALRMTRNAGWTKVEVQSNFKSIVDQINSGNIQEESLKTILENIEEMRRSFDLCCFST